MNNINYTTVVGLDVHKESIAVAILPWDCDRVVGRGKAHQVAVVGVARELAGFAWSIARYFPGEASVS